MKIRIATWNMNARVNIEEAWKYLCEKYDIDIILFQEGKETANKHVVWNIIGGNRKWGSGIYSPKYKLTEEKVETAYKGVFVVANALIGDKNLTMISLYGILTGTYGLTDLHNNISELTKILADNKRKIIFGGDLNADTQWDQKYGHEAHKIFFDRLKDFGLSNCYDLKGNTKPIKTFRSKKSNIDWQTDHLFISKSLKKHWIDCQVLYDEKIEEYSDHNPVMIVLDI
jgi:endonuclease/exonuclease/phosphatase (EEP) superfamily protein YafD